MLGVDVDYDEAIASADGDVGCRPLPPPFVYLVEIARGVVQPVIGERLFIALAGEYPPPLAGELDRRLVARTTLANRNDMWRCRAVQA